MSKTLIVASALFAAFAIGATRHGPRRVSTFARTASHRADRARAARRRAPRRARRPAVRYGHAVPRTGPPPVYAATLPRDLPRLFELPSTMGTTTVRTTAGSASASTTATRTAPTTTRAITAGTTAGTTGTPWTATRIRRPDTSRRIRATTTAASASRTRRAMRRCSPTATTWESWTTSTARSSGSPLEPGAHRIEIRAPGLEPLDFDVNVLAGQTITYHAQMRGMR